MYEMLFHPAFWMPLAGLAIAIGVFVYGNNRVRPPIRNAGLGLVALVLVWCAIAYVVDTPVERCIGRTKGILAAVDDGDWKALRTLIDSSTTLEMFHGPDQIAAAAESAATNYGLTDIHMLPADVLEGPGTVNIGFTALLEGKQATTSTWRFEYELRPDAVVLTRIVPISVGTVPLDQLRDLMKKFR